MTFKEIASMIASTSLPYAYFSFDEGNAPDPPFICFYYAESNDFVADDTNYQKVESLIIELYTSNKDFTVEKTVEDVLRSSGLVYSRSETYIASERLYEVIYETDVLITEEDPVTTEE